MNNIKERNDIIAVGRELLETGLVARTWGNISAREDSDKFLITPSGLDYITMKDSDIVEVNIETGEWDGDIKPSGERGVHRAAYKVFNDVNFVVHTHQTYATAIGIAGFESLDITEEEKEKLGGVGIAEYGLPGSEKLTNAVADTLKAGNHVVLMLHHGVLICGNSKEDAMERTRLLEEICKRNVTITCAKDTNNENVDGKEGNLDSKGKIQPDKFEKNKLEDLILSLQEKHKFVALVDTKELIEVSNNCKKIVSQLDDVSQMVGGRVNTYRIDRLAKALEKTNAILVEGYGAIVRADNQDDLEALSVLMQKMAVVKLHTIASRKNVKISAFDSIYMHHIYVTKYSKQKK